MKRVSSLMGLLFVCLLLAVALPPQARGQVLDKCQAAKIKAAGNKTFDKTKCRAKALQRGLAVDPLCLAKAEHKFAAAITKADTLGSCSGTATDLEAAVDQSVDTYTAIVSAPVTYSCASPGDGGSSQCGGSCPPGYTCTVTAGAYCICLAGVCDGGSGPLTCNGSCPSPGSCTDGLLGCVCGY